MKKFNEMYKLYGVKAATIIADEEDVYIYQSEENFPVELQNIVRARYSTYQAHLLIQSLARPTLPSN